MQKPGPSERYAAARRRGVPADHKRELALLQEFTRCESVAALAGAIAARLPRKARPEDLIAQAGLTPRRMDR
jgi:hypothetical protein